MPMIEEIKSLCRQGKMEWTSHVQQRILQREISRQDVKEAIVSGEIIENYPEDYPFPSCLMLGRNQIHVVWSAASAPEYCGLSRPIVQ